MEYKWSVLTVTTVGVLMSGIDSRILIIGLPQIAAAMHADAVQAVWFTQGYALASTVLTLLIGRVSDIFGRTRLYIAGFAVFTICSLLTGSAQSPEHIIIFRIIQGIGSSMIWTNSMAMITDATPREGLGFSLGVNQIAKNLGSVLGLTVSGLILFFLDWRFLFYINVPIGIFGTIWAQVRLREIAKTERGAPIDWVGFGTFAIALSAFLLALTYAAYGIAEQDIVEVLLVVSVVAIFLFVWYERRTISPLLDLKLLRIREFGSAISALTINVLAFGSLALLLSLYFQLVVGLSPLDAGVRLLPLDLATVRMGPLSGKLSDRFGQSPFIISGIGLASVAIYMFSTVDISTPYLEIVIYMILLGGGTSVFLAPNSSFGMMAVPAERRGVAASIRSTYWDVGATVSLNLVLWIMTIIVPYGLISNMISTISPLGISLTDRVLFMNGLKTAYLWLAALNSMALIPSVLGILRKRST